MSIYHLHCQIIGKSAGRSAIAAAAYRAGDRLLDYKSGKTYDYSRKQGIVYSKIFLCENAPTGYEDREILWNAVHDVEKVKNAQLAREIEVALPVELSFDEHVKIIEEYCGKMAADGMIVDVSIHNKSDGNPHAHILLTLREIDSCGRWAQVKEKKVYALDNEGNRIAIIDPETEQQKIGPSGRKMWKRIKQTGSKWDKKEMLNIWRKDWAETCNKYIEEHNEKNLDITKVLAPEPVSCIDHRSYVEQGINKIPTVHEGYMARKIEREGEKSFRCSENRWRRKLNKTLEQLNQALKDALLSFEKYLDLFAKEERRHEEAVGKYRCFEDGKIFENDRKTRTPDKRDVSLYSEIESREREVTGETGRMYEIIKSYMKRFKEREQRYYNFLKQEERSEISKRRSGFELEL